MTPTPNLAQLRALLAKATPGPWVIEGRADTFNIHAGLRKCIARLQKKAGAAGDAECIVALHAAAPGLLDLAERAEVAEKDLDAALALTKLAEDELEPLLVRLNAAEALVAELQRDLERLDGLIHLATRPTPDSHRSRGVRLLNGGSGRWSVFSENGVGTGKRLAVKCETAREAIDFALARQREK